MIIIDSHAHIYPERIAEKATKSIGEFYDLQMNCIGSVPRLLACGKEANVSRFIVHSVALDPKRVHSINDFVAGETAAHPELYGFMTLHPDMEEADIEGEIDRAIELNLHGIKLHPDIQQFQIDGAGALKIYRANRGRLPILLHTGDKRYNYSQPARLANIAKQFKNTTFIGAHFGGYSCWEQLDCYKGLDNVFFDTSSTLFVLDHKRAAELILELGPSRFFFGTDFPIIAHKDELERFLSLPLSDKIKQEILGENILNVPAFLPLKKSL